MKPIRFYPLLLFLLVAACTAAELVPARAMQAGNGTDKVLIEQVIASMLNQQAIRLGDDAFVNSSEIIIERRPLTRTEGQRFPGRSLETPVHFRLWKQDETCLLEYVETGTFRELEGFACTSLMNH